MKVVGGTDYDPWNTEQDGSSANEGKPRRVSRTSGEYSADEFYVRSTNKHDHSEQTRIRIPGDVLGELSALIASGRIPEYRTISDFFRDAAVHRLKYVVECLDDEVLERFVVRQVSIANVDRLEREHVVLDGIVAAWKKRVSVAKDCKDEIGLRQARELIVLDVEWLREPYKGKLKEVLDGIRLE